MPATDTLLLAALTWPALFYWGSAAVSVPIIIHLLAKRRYKRVRWAAMEFLLQAERENRRKINIRELILLLLRCLAVFLLGFLLARPFVAPEQLGAALGTQQPTRHVVVLDDSFSMAYSAGGRTTMDHATAAVVHIVGALRERAASDRLTVLKISEPEAPLLDSLGLAEVSLEELGQTLSGVAASSLVARFDDWLVQLRADVEALGQAGPLALYIISDFQRSDWLRRGAADAEADGRSPLSVLGDWPRERVPLELTLVQVAAAQRPNTAVLALRGEQAQVVGGVENRFSATVANLASRQSPAQTLQVFLDDAAQQGAAVPELAPGEQVDVAFTLIPAVGGGQALRAQLPPDALSLDNERSVALDVQPAVEVLLVNGEPGVSAIIDEVALLETALQPEGDVFSGVAVTTVDDAELDTTRLDDMHVVVLANVYRPGEEAVSRLEAFVGSGGGLVVFLGDQVDHDIYNERLWKDGGGLLPAALGRMQLTPAGQRPPGIVERVPGYPMLRVFSGADNIFRQNVFFWQYFECLPPPADPDAATAAAVRVVAEYGDDQHTPAIIEKRYGGGRVLLMTSSCDLEWNDWPKSPSYVVAMLEMVQQLAARSQQPETVAGAEVRVPAGGATFDHQAMWRQPGYPVAPEVEVLAQPAGAEFEWRLRPRRIGMHRLLLRDAEGRTHQRLLAVNPDPQESDLAASNAQQLRQAAPDVPFEYITDLQSLASTFADQRREMWPLILVSVFALLMCEQYLAERFGRV